MTVSRIGNIMLGTTDLRTGIYVLQQYAGVTSPIPVDRDGVS